MVAWIVALVLALIVVLLIALYRRAMSDTNGLYALYVRVLLDENVAASQRGNLLGFIRQTPAANAHELDAKAHNAVTEAAGAYGRAGTNLLATSGLLWQARETITKAR